MKFKRISLPFGAKLMYVKNKINKSTNVDVSFDAGAAREDIPGLAHFVEHMFFSGTDKLTEQEVKKEYFRFSYANAFTTFQEIRFLGRIFTNELSDYFSTVAMLLTETNFSDKAIENEKKIVIQEINEKKDDFKSIFYNYNLSKIYNHDFINADVIGTEESVKNIKREDIINFVKKHFIANNMEVYICTPLSLKKVKKLVIENLINKLQINNNFTKADLFYFDINNFNFLQSDYKDIKKIYLCINFKINRTIKDLDFYMKEGLLSYIINDISYGLMKKLRLDKSLVYSASYFVSYSKDASIAKIITETNKNNANQIIEAVAEYVNELKEKGFTLEQLNLAKRKLRYAYESRSITPRTLLDKLYEYRKYDKVLDDEYYYNSTMKMTLDEANEMVKEIFNCTNIGCTVYGDINEKNLMNEKKFFKLFKVKNG